MNFEYNEDQLAIKEMAKNFAETELMPMPQNGIKKRFFQLKLLKEQRI